MHIEDDIMLYMEKETKIFELEQELYWYKKTYIAELLVVFWFYMMGIFWFQLNMREYELQERVDFFDVGHTDRKNGNQSPPIKK